MTWKKIIEDDKQYVSKIHEIAFLFEKRIKIENDFLFTGKLGISLFCFNYGRLFNNDKFIEIGYKYLEKSFKAINSSISGYSLSNGICGFYWLLKELEKEEFITKEIFENWNIIEESLVQRINYEINTKNWDFLHGIMGIVWCFFKFNQVLLREFSLPLLEQFESQGINLDDGSIAWHAYKVNHDKSVNKIYSMGLAHGIPGIILILSNLTKYNIESNISKELLNRSFLFIKNHPLDFEKFNYYFPQYIDLPDGTYSSRNRLAWCYGDLGLGFGLFKGGLNYSNNEMSKLGLKVLMNCSTKKSFEETLTVDAGFCHGTVGNAHIFNRLYQETNIIEFKKAAQFWYEKTLQFATFNNGCAGYKSYDSDNKWIKNYGLLEGAAGIGLSLMSAISENEPSWDNCFLLS
ncbi:MAG: lanthionine synthetase C family protein [Bacteroidales bacterium]|nr:lanthionine synthetase C family protein [Bacteroidales bacterium]